MQKHDQTFLYLQHIFHDLMLIACENGYKTTPYLNSSEISSVKTTNFSLQRLHSSVFKITGSLPKLLFSSVSAIEKNDKQYDLRIVKYYHIA